MTRVAGKFKALTLANLRAAAWALRATTRVRRQLRDGGLQAVALPAVPARCASGRRGVEAVLRRRRVSCLEGALVDQAWLTAHGDPQAVVIGVGHPGEQFGAHAWLEGQAARESDGFVELMRHPATVAGRRDPHR